MRGKKNTPPVLCDERVRICGALAGNLDVGSSEWLDLEGGAPTGTSRPGRRRVKGDVERELRRSRCHGWRCTTWSHWLTTCRNSSLCACRGVMCVFWPAIVALSKHSKPRTACALHGWQVAFAEGEVCHGGRERRGKKTSLAAGCAGSAFDFSLSLQRPTPRVHDYCTVGRWQPTRQRREGAGEVVADVANSAGDGGRPPARRTHVGAWLVRHITAAIFKAGASSGVGQASEQASKAKQSATPPAVYPLLCTTYSLGRGRQGPISALCPGPASSCDAATARQLADSAAGRALACIEGAGGKQEQLASYL